MHVCFCCVCFSFTLLSQETGWVECLRNDLFCVEWDVKHQSVLQSRPELTSFPLVFFCSCSKENFCGYRFSKAGCCPVTQRTVCQGSEGISKHSLSLYFHPALDCQGKSCRSLCVGYMMPVKGKKGFRYSLPSVGPGADPGVQAVSTQVT